MAWECLHRFYVEIPGDLPENAYVWQELKGTIKEFRRDGSYRTVEIDEVEVFEVRAGGHAGPDPHSWASPYPEFCAQEASLEANLSLKVIEPLQQAPSAYMCFRSVVTYFEPQGGDDNQSIDESDWDPSDFAISTVPGVSGTYTEYHDPKHCKSRRMQDSSVPTPDSGGGGKGTSTPGSGGSGPLGPARPGGPTQDGGEREGFERSATPDPGRWEA